MHWNVRSILRDQVLDADCDVPDALLAERWNNEHPSTPATIADVRRIRMQNGVCRRPGEPTEATIAKRIKKVQGEWDAATERLRSGHPIRNERHYEFPMVHDPSPIACPVERWDGSDAEREQER